MTNFGPLIAELMKRNQLSYADLAATVGISQSFAHKLRTGGQKWVDADLLTKIVAALTSDPTEQLRLVRAYLLDQLPESMQEQIDISAKVHGPKDQQLTTTLPQLRRELEILAVEAETDGDLRDLINRLARLVAPEKFLQLPNKPVKY